MKWEYKVTTIKSEDRGSYQEMSEAMNRLGAEGWELVTAGNGVYWYKRPKGK